MWGVELVIIGCMIAVNALFAAYEIALASLSVSRLHVLIGENKSGAKAALEMKENIEGSLATVQLGITLVGAIAAATGGAGAEEKLVPLLEETFRMSEGIAEFLALALVVLPLTVITIIFWRTDPQGFCPAKQGMGVLKDVPTYAMVGVERGAGRVDSGNGGDEIHATWESPLAGPN